MDAAQGAAGPPARAELRATLRAYVRWTLYTPGSDRATPPLSLPRLQPAAIADADVYAARPGRADARIDAAGRPRPRVIQLREGTPTLGRGPSDHDPVAMQADHAAGWRRYAETELAGQPAILQFERATVVALVQRLSPRDQQAIWDIAHCAMKEAAQRHRCSLAAIKVAARDALDRLLILLYASSGQRVA